MGTELQLLKCRDDFGDNVVGKLLETGKGNCKFTLYEID